jgi:hypothetical protein
MCLLQCQGLACVISFDAECTGIKMVAGKFESRCSPINPPKAPLHVKESELGNLEDLLQPSKAPSLTMNHKLDFSPFLSAPSIASSQGRGSGIVAHPLTVLY